MKTPPVTLTNPFRALALSQGLYLLINGVWPLLHMGSFEAVTGRKADRWLVRTVGTQMMAIGAALAAAAGRKEPPALEATLAGAGSAVGMAVIEVANVARRRIRPVYLLDTVFQLLFISGWLWLWRRRRTLRA